MYMPECNGVGGVDVYPRMQMGRQKGVVCIPKCDTGRQKGVVCIPECNGPGRGEGGLVCIPECSWAGREGVVKRAVRILLECILVSKTFD